LASNRVIRFLSSLKVMRLRVRRELDWVTRTKGIVKHKGPPLKPAEEDEAVAHAVVQDYEETLKRMEG
jgi:hypothetical protein